MPKENSVISSIWESKVDNSLFKILESNPSQTADGQYILGVAVGPTFFPDTVSGNGIFYSKQEWENAISDSKFQQRLKDNLVFGTIGHDINLTDTEIRQGQLSHIVSDVWIENDIGYAKYLILNTQPGRVLNLLLRAESKLSTSTRANGILINAGDRMEARELVLERIDFVIDPGYIQAKPQLIESLKKENFYMKTEAKAASNQALTILESQLSGVQDVNNQRLIYESMSEIRQEIAESRASLGLYKEFGSPLEISEKLNKLKIYESISEDPKELKDVIEQTEDTIDDLNTKVTELKTENRMLSDQLSADDKKEDLDESEGDDDQSELEQFRSLIGTPEQLENLIDSSDEAKNELTKFTDLIGSPEDLERLIESTNEDIVNQIADDENIPTKVVEHLLNGNLSPKKTRNIIRAIKESIEGEAEEENKDAEYTDEEVDDYDEDEASDYDYDDEDYDDLDDDDEDEEMSLQEAISRRRRALKNKMAAKRSIRSESKKPAATRKRKSRIQESKTKTTAKRSNGEQKTILAESLISRNNTAKRSKRTNVISK